MDVIERYLQAIEFWLPKQQRRDIIAEISEDLRSEIEERQNAFGRALTQTEIELAIHQRGSPLLVANRYLPQRYLIGPVLFPIYLFVLKIYLLVGLPLWCVASVTALHFEHSTLNWPQTLGSVFGSLWSIAFIAIGTITAAFAVLQQIDWQNRLLECWNPKKLPPIRNSNSIPRTSSAVEVSVNMAVFFWWLSSAWSPAVFGLQISFRPVWAYFFWGFLATTFLNGAFAAVNFARPYWTSQRALGRLFIDVAGGVLFAWLLKADAIATITIAGDSAARGLQIRSGVDWWLAQIFPYAILAVLIIAIVDLYRVLRVNRREGRLKAQPIAV